MTISRCGFSLLLAFFSAAFVLPGSAQSAALHGKRISVGTEGAAACPASLTVRHGSSAGSLVVSTQNGVATSAQTLEIHLLNYSSHEIASMDAVVRLASAGLHLQPLAGAQESSAAREIPMHEDQRIGGNSDASFQWSLSDLNPVNVVELRQIAYRDGSVWTAGSPHACEFRPDSIMLVSQR